MGCYSVSIVRKKEREAKGARKKKNWPAKPTHPGLGSVLSGKAGGITDAYRLFQSCPTVLLRLLLPLLRHLSAPTFFFPRVLDTSRDLRLHCFRKLISPLS